MLNVADERGPGAVPGHYSAETILQEPILVPINMIILMLVLKFDFDLYNVISDENFCTILYPTKT